MKFYLTGNIDVFYPRLRDTSVSPQCVEMQKHISLEEKTIDEPTRETAVAQIQGITPCLVAEYRNHEKHEVTRIRIHVSLIAQAPGVRSWETEQEFRIQTWNKAVENLLSRNVSV